MTRVAFPDPASVGPAFQAVVSGRPPLNLDRMLPRAGALAPIWIAFGRTIREDLSITQRQCEIAIVRTGVLCDAAYEVHHHSMLARRAGVSAAELDAIRLGDETGLPHADAVILAYTDALVRDVRADDATFSAIEAELGADGVAELTLVIGFYLMVCRFLRNFDIAIEDDQQRIWA